MPRPRAPSLRALRYLQSRRIVHRDVKPENFLLAGELLKVCDFGSAEYLQPGQRLQGKVGSLSYAAPEVYSAAGAGLEADA